MSATFTGLAPPSPREGRIYLPRLQHPTVVRPPILPVIRRPQERSTSLLALVCSLGIACQSELVRTSLFQGSAS